MGNLYRKNTDFWRKVPPLSIQTFRQRLSDSLTELDKTAHASHEYFAFHGSYFTKIFSVSLFYGSRYYPLNNLGDPEYCTKIMVTPTKPIMVIEHFLFGNSTNRWEEFCQSYEGPVIRKFSTTTQVTLQLHYDTLDDCTYADDLKRYYQYMREKPANVIPFRLQ